MADSQLGISVVSLRVRCSRIIRETATSIGVLLVSTAALSGVLTGKSIEVHAISVLVFGIMAAAALVVIAAMLVSLLRFLRTIYDLLKAALAYGFVSCIYQSAAFHTRIMHFEELKSYRVLVRATDQLVQATKAGVNLDRAPPKKGRRKNPKWVDACCPGNRS